jgi:hypothetical protein
LKVESFDEKLRRCKSNWLRHVPRMNNSRTPKAVLNYRRNKRRRIGRLLKRLLDEAEIIVGLAKSNSWRMMIVMIMIMMKQKLHTASGYGRSFPSKKCLGAHLIWHKKFENFTAILVNIQFFWDGRCLHLTLTQVLKNSPALR